MANFVGSARTNYFRVKDVEAFQEWVREFDCYAFEKDGRHGFYSTDPDTGCFPSYRYDEESDDHIEVDLAAELSKHLAEGEVAVLMEAGAEKLRYISGYAIAVAWDGRTVNVSLNDIYDKAKSAFNVVPTDASY